MAASANGERLCCLQDLLGQRDHFRARGIALAAQPHDEASRMVDEFAGRPFFNPFCHRDGDTGVIRRPLMQSGLRKRIGRALEGERGAIEQRGGRGLHVLGIGEDETFGRLIKCEAEADFAGCRDGGVAIAKTGDRAGQIIGAVMTAEQRHCGRTVFRHCDHRRFAVLVLQVR